MLLCINYFLTIFLFTIYKSYYLSDNRVKNIDILKVFKHEFLSRHQLFLRKNNFCEKVANLLENCQ